MPIFRSLGALAIAALVGVSPGQTNSPPPQALAAYRAYWNATLTDFAMISVCAGTAAMAAVDGDLARAARVLAYGRKFADRVNGALGRVPPDWRERVAPHLSQAALALTANGSALRLYLAHGRVGDLKTAQNAQARAAAELVAAATQAKAAYAAMGGKASDLESVPYATQIANAALASAMGDTDTDSQ